MTDRATVARIYRETFAADYACDPALFDAEGIFFVPSAFREGRRNYPRQEHDLAVCTLGRGIVVNFSPDRRAWAESSLAGLDGRALFSPRTLGAMDNLVRADGQVMRGPVMGYACSDDSFVAPPAPADVTIELVGRAGVESLFEVSGFDMAVGRDGDDLRPILYAAVARHDGAIVALAGAGLERERLFELGVQVRPAWQGRGIGRAVVGVVTRAVLEEGAAPVYTTWAANLGSRNLCLGLGYRPAWCEAYALDETP